MVSLGQCAAAAASVRNVGCPALRIDPEWPCIELEWPCIEPDWPCIEPDWAPAPIDDAGWVAVPLAAPVVVPDVDVAVCEGLQAAKNTAQAASVRTFECFILRRFDPLGMCPTRAHAEGTWDVVRVSPHTPRRRAILAETHSFAFDANQRIYVTDNVHGILVFAPNPSGALNEAPVANIPRNATTGLFYPRGIALDSSGKI
jgi:hypothetical protein